MCMRICAGVGGKPPHILNLSEMDKASSILSPLYLRHLTVHITCEAGRALKSSQYPALKRKILYFPAVELWLSPLC
jgi:hypothetical protein